MTNSTRQASGLAFAQNALAAFFLAMVSFCAVLATAPFAHAQSDEAQPYGSDRVDIETFYDGLDGYGRWRNDPEYGEVWLPEIDDPSWRPYTRGRWAYVEEHGWTWVSDEPWGWATYHYGRWRRDDDLGWMWVPGFEWAPAWVAWRDGDDYVGWAPLPPEATFRDSGGLSLSASFYDEPRYAGYWCFVRPNLITERQLYRHVKPYRFNRDLIRETRPATRYDFVQRRVFNFGVDPRRFESRYGHTIPRGRVTFSTDPDARSGGGRGRNPTLFRPDSRRPTLPPAPRPDGRPDTRPARPTGGGPDARPPTPGDTTGGRPRRGDPPVTQTPGPSPQTQTQQPQTQPPRPRPDGAGPGTGGPNTGGPGQRPTTDGGPPQRRRDPQPPPPTPGPTPPTTTAPPPQVKPPPVQQPQTQPSRPRGEDGGGPPQRRPDQRPEGRPDPRPEGRPDSRRETQPPPQRPVAPTVVNPPRPQPPPQAQPQPKPQPPPPPAKQPPPSAKPGQPDANGPPPGKG